jgi:hypothetical protein
VFSRESRAIRMQVHGACCQPGRQGVTNQMPLTDILLKYGKDLHCRGNALLPPPSCQKAPHLQPRGITDGDRAWFLQVFLRFLRPCFVEVPFCQGARLKVGNFAYRASRSSRMSFLLSFRIRGIFSRRSR